MSRQAEPPRAAVLAVGMTTPVGLGARASAAAVRAGITRIRTSTIHLRAWEGQRMGLVEEEHLHPLSPEVEEMTRGCPDRHRRMLQLATLAFREASATLKPPAPPPLLLALPETPASGVEALGPDFLSHLARQTGVAFDVRRSQLFRQGRAGGLLALQRGLELLAARQAEYVYVGGVDTYLDLRMLIGLEREKRLLTPASTEGFIPGEGAAFLLLGLPRTAKDAGMEVLAHVLGVGTGSEEGHLYSERPHLGDGLADSLRALFAGLPPKLPRVETVYAGMNGERLWGREWGVAYLRNAEHLQENPRMEHPVEFIGDPGAALGTLMAGLAAIGLQKGYRQGPCLLWCGSDRAERAAALLHSTAS
ncbi:hypothetical protein ACLESO_35665 [Pyxidicoccus sp. 3LG]